MAVVCLSTFGLIRLSGTASVANAASGKIDAASGKANAAKRVTVDGKTAVSCSEATKQNLRDAGYGNTEIGKFCSDQRDSGIQVFETDVNNPAEAESYVETMKEYGCRKVALSTERREGILWATVYSWDCALRQTTSCPTAWDLSPNAGAGETSSGAKPRMPIQQRFPLRSAGNTSESGEPSGGGYAIALCLSKEAAARYAEKPARAEKPAERKGIAN